jgi:hypothetical protein
MEKKQHREKEKPLKMKEIIVSNNPEIYNSYGEVIKVSKENFPSLKHKIEKIVQSK